MLRIGQRGVVAEMQQSLVSHLAALGQQRDVALRSRARGERSGGWGGEVDAMETPASKLVRPWNKGLLVGQKRPLLPRQVWSIRVRLELSAPLRDVALFNLAIDSKLRACDLIRLKIEDICSGEVVRDRGSVTQMKTGRPVQFEITEVTRQSVERFLAHRSPADAPYLFSQPFRDTTTHFDAAVRAHCASLDQEHRLGRSCVRNAFASSHKGCANLSQDRKSKGSSAVARSRQDRNDGPLPGRRGRRRLTFIRAS